MDAVNQEKSIRREEPQSTPIPAAGKSDKLDDKAVELNVVPRAKSDGSPTYGDTPVASIATGSGVAVFKWVARRLATLMISLVAVLVSIVTWDQYVTSPWTRDGRVRVQVASVAPEVSGKIKELRIVDNQFVHKGDVLYQIDPFDFDVALRTSKAVLEQRQADVHVKELQSERRRRLSDLATTPEEQQVFEGNAIQAKAAVDAAQQQVAQADINRRRTEVRSPVNGFVANLLLREGDYAHTGVSNVSIIDTDSFWVDGYFEETKLARLCTGDRAEAKLMGYAMPILGHVTTVTRGVSVSNAVAVPRVSPTSTRFIPGCASHSECRFELRSTMFHRACRSCLEPRQL
jgi:RND family efflux transporter MFP subunit